MNLLTTLTTISSENISSNPEAALKVLIAGLQSSFNADECIFIKELNNELDPVFIEEDDKYFQLTECRSTLEILVQRLTLSGYNELTVGSDKNLVFDGKKIKAGQVVKIAEPGKLTGYVILLNYFRNFTPLSDSERANLSVYINVLGARFSAYQSASNLAKRNDSLNSIEALATIGCWEVDLIRSTVYWSPQTKAIHEVPDNYVPDLETAIAFYKEGVDRDKISEAVQRGIDEGKPWNLEVRLITPEGKEKWVAALGCPEFIDGKCVRLFGAFQDINQKVLSKAILKEKNRCLQESVEARNNLLSRLSHELRTPINGIYGMLETADVSTPKSILRERLDIARKSALQLTALIDGITDFNALLENDFTLLYENISLTEVFTDICNSFQSSFTEKGVKLNVKFNLPIDSVLADRSKISQIIGHLLDNALEFTPSGYTDVFIGSREEEGFVLVEGSIKDSGPGISKHDLAHLFSPFSQSTTRMNLPGPGKGLGLARVSKLCSAMNGRCYAESEYGKGSQFNFFLKLKKGACTSQQTPAFQPDFSKLRALVVDDVETNRLVAEFMLNEIGVEVEHAVNGLAAIEACRANHYDVIFMDCHMPVMDGFQSTNQIKCEFENDVVVVAMTADTTPSTRLKCFEAGMTEIVTKPFTINALADVLSVVSSKKTCR